MNHDPLQVAAMEAVGKVQRTAGDATGVLEHANRTP